MKLRDLLSTIWKRRLVVALVLAFCLFGGGLYAFSKPSQTYASSATIVFLPNSKSQTVAPVESVESLLTTYAVVAESEKTVAAAEQILGHSLPGNIVATTGAGSWVLAITSEARTAAAAAETARAATKALTESIRDNGLIQPDVVNQPVVSSIPLETRSPAMIIAIAAVVGLVGGILLALLVDNLVSLPEGSAAAPARSPEQSA